MKRELVLLSLLFLAAVMMIASSSAAFAPKKDRPQVLIWGKSSANDVFHGVYGKCRQYWLWHAQQRQQDVQGTPCPFGPFAADIVDHHNTEETNVHIDGWNCGKFLEGNSGLRGASIDPSLHAELESIHRLMDCNRHPELCSAVTTTNSSGTFTTYTQLHARDKAWWGQLTMYSTGESCVLDAAAEAYAGFGEVVYGFPNDEQLAAGWELFDLDSWDVAMNARTPTLMDTNVWNVDIDLFRPLYVWQYNTSVPCPAGCGRVTADALCSKMA